MEKQLSVCQLAITRVMSELTLSPQIVLLAHVLTEKYAALDHLHTVVFRISRQNLVSGNHPAMLGTLRRSAVALNRYANGACCVMLYATTFEG